MASTLNASTTLGLISSADTSGVLQLQTANTAAVTINASQNVGIGTASPSYKLDVNISSGPVRINSNTGSANSAGYLLGNSLRAWSILTSSNTGGPLIISDETAGGAVRATLDSSGNLGLGVTPSAWGSGYKAMQVGSQLSVAYSGGYAIFSNNTYNNSGNKYIASDYATQYYQQGGQHVWGTAASGTAGNAITFTQALTLDASGNLLLGTTSNASNRRLLVESSTTSGYPFEFKNTASSGTPYGFVISYSGTAPNNTGSSFLYLADNAALRLEVRSNGGVANYSANNVNLSDERTKTDIQDAGSYLSKICAIPVRTFKYKDQTDDLLNLGVIAQEVEAVAPELVDAIGFGETPEDGVPLKAIYQTDMQYALMKALQELKSEFDAYKAAHP